MRNWVVLAATMCGVLMASLALTNGGVAQQRPASPTDCAMRDAPFSIDSPLIDLLLNPTARGVLSRAMPGRLERMPARFAGTEPPTFTAILTLRQGGMLTGLAADQLPTIDAELRAIVVTDADRVARCARYDDDRPSFNLARGRPRLLVFDKIVGFRDDPSVAAADAMFAEMATRNGWQIVRTDRAGAFNPATLRQFDAVVWNNISGDVLTLSQRRALQAYIERGGGFVAVHGSAGDPVYFWDWYADRLIGARFLAHPMNPQFQDARVVTSSDHPLSAGLPADWVMNEEWYSFRSNPRAAGARVILSLDESTYAPDGPGGVNLRMGDHPIAWTNCIGRGRAFYSAIGHRPENYAQPQHVRLIENALRWAANRRAVCPR